MLSALPAVSAADGTGADGYGEYRCAVEILNALGITDISEKGFSEQDKVSRELFAEGVASMMTENLSDFELAPYGDLSAGDKGLMYLHSVGLVDGTGRNVFEPNSSITLEQAAKIAVSALGFGELSYYKGGYSTGFLTEAKKAGLLDGVNAAATDTLNMGNYIKLLYNLLQTDILEQKTFGSSNTYYRIDGNTLVSVYRNIRRGEGIVTENRFSGLYSAADSTAEGRVMIDKEFYAVGDTDAEQLLGYSTEFYYRDLRGSDERDLLYITAKQSNRTVKIKAADITSFNSGTYSYEKENGKTADIKIAADTAVFYNGVFQSTLAAEKYIPSYGSVEFISNDGDGAYELVKIEDISLTVVSTVSADGLSVYDKYDREYNIDLSDAEYSLYNSKGKAADITALADGNTVEAVRTESAGGVYYRLTLVTDTVSGSIDRFKSREVKVTNPVTSKEDTAAEYTEIYIDGEKYDVSYRLAELILKKSVNEPSIGSTYVFSLNTEGELVCFDTVDERGFRLGYLKRFANDGNDISPEPKVRIFDQSASWETYSLAKTVKINGKAVRSDTIKNMVAYIGRICKYELSISGEVKSMYFPSENDESFKTVYSTKSAYYRTYAAGGVFGPQSDKEGATCSLTSGAYVFVIPDKEPTEVNELSEGYQYSVVAPGKLKTYITYSSAELYNTTGEIGIGDAALVKIKNSGYAYNHYGERPIVVSECQNVMVGDEVKTAISAFYNGNEIQITVDDRRTDQSVFPIKSGDVIYCFMQSDGELRLYDSQQYYHKILDYDEQNPVFAQAFNWNLAGPVGVSYSSAMGSDQRIRYGSVYKADNEYLWLNVGTDPSDTSKVEAARCSNARIYVYSKDKKKFEIGKTSDIVGYTSDRVNYSKALIVYNNGFTEIVIY